MYRIKHDSHDHHEKGEYDPLKWFNRLSLFYGVSIASQGHGRLTRLQVLYTRFNRLVLVLNTLYYLIFFGNINFRRIKLFNMDLMYYCFGRIIHVLILQFYGNKIWNLIKIMTRNCSLRQQKVIERITVYVWVFNIIDRITCLFAVIFLYDFKLTISIIINLIVTSVSVNFVFHSFSLYLLVFMSFYFNTNRVFLEMKKCTNPLFLVHKTSQIKKYMNEVNKIAAIPFLMTLPYLFIALPSSFSRSKDFSYIFAVILFVITLSYSALIIITVITVIVFKNKLESQRQDLLDSLMASYGAKFLLTNEWKICVHRLLDDKLFDFSVFSLFSIDFTFLMSFSSAVITFSILFFQIENNT